PLRSGDSGPHGIEKDAATVAAESEARYPCTMQISEKRSRNLKQHLLLIKRAQGHGRKAARNPRVSVPAHSKKLAIGAPRTLLHGSVVRRRGSDGVSEP